MINCTPDNASIPYPFYLYPHSAAITLNHLSDPTTSTSDVLSETLFSHSITLRNLHSAVFDFFVLNFINKYTKPYPLNTNKATIPASLQPKYFSVKFNVAK